MTELELRQMFKNLSDCYADTGRFENDGSYTEGEVIQAMTEDRFIEALKEAKFITSNTVLGGDSEQFYCVSSNALVYGKPCEKWCGDENCKTLCKQ
jgi:hypothetical protein